MVCDALNCTERGRSFVLEDATPPLKRHYCSKHACTLVDICRNPTPIIWSTPDSFTAREGYSGTICYDGASVSNANDIRKRFEQENVMFE